MNKQENTKLVQQFYENFKNGDIKALLNLLSDNIEWQLPEIENVPFAGKRRGHEQMGPPDAGIVPANAKRLLLHNRCKPASQHGIAGSAGQQPSGVV